MRKKNNAPNPIHKCWKNWSNSSSSMEADIIVEGFKQSENMYGAKYWRLVADGDSNVYKRILDARPYSNITVQKIECRNHLLRNFCNNLKEVQKNKKYGPYSRRKELGSKILILQ